MSNKTFALLELIEQSPRSKYISFSEFDNDDLKDFRSKLASRNWFTQVLDAQRFLSEESLFECFRTELDFPTYFGNNWDAFIDCVSDLSWLDSDQICIVIDNWESFSKDHPETAKSLIEVFGIIIDRLQESGLEKRLIFVLLMKH